MSSNNTTTNADDNKNGTTTTTNSVAVGANVTTLTSDEKFEKELEEVCLCFSFFGRIMLLY
jgi:hypothetical protein